MMNNKKNVIKNIVSLYGFSIAKLVFPLITLPYLTRVLSVDAYGVVSYVKTVMLYLQLIVDFGFMLSGTKEIVANNNNQQEINKTVSNITTARLLMASVSLGILIILCYLLPILRTAKVFSLLSFIPVFLSIFLFDFVFRGLEKMHVLTIRFFLMKGISTALTFLLIKNDANLILIPVLDIIGSFAAMVWVYFSLRKIHIHFVAPSVEKTIGELRESSMYFISNMATTLFGALNTLLIGVFLSKSDIAYWSVCLQIVSAIQIMYNPIIDGIYPDMIKNRNFNLVKRIQQLFMPIILVGCLFILVISKYALLIIAGEKYISAYIVLNSLTPVLFFGFPAMLLGWPSLGAIGKVREVTLSTIFTGCFQLIGLLVLAIIGKFGLIEISLLRGCTEVVLFVTRRVMCAKWKQLFNYEKL